MAASEAMHVGDAWNEDVTGAEGVGMRAVLIDRAAGHNGDRLRVGSLVDVLKVASDCSVS